MNDSTQNAGKPLLTVMHVITEHDCELIEQDMPRRMKARLEDISCKQKAKARWPFRVAYWILCAFFIVMGIGLIRSDTSDGIICLVVGSSFVLFRLALYVLTRLTVSLVRLIYRRGVGRKFKWDFDETGATMGESIPLDTIKSAAFTKAGVVLLVKRLGQDGSVPVVSAQTDVITTRLREMVEKYAAEKTKNPSGPVPASGRIFIFRSVRNYLLARLILSTIGRKSLPRTNRKTRGSWNVDDSNINLVGLKHYPWAKYQSFDLADAGLALLDKKGEPSWYIPASAVSDPAVRTQLAEILNKHFRPAGIPPPLPKSVTPSG